ncbi:MAG: hypothetical protein IJ106_09230 [Parasporobacterium sp.]|nr:hypothetical protein [Parasporobacterium sp.]
MKYLKQKTAVAFLALLLTLSLSSAAVLASGVQPGEGAGQIGGEISVNVPGESEPGESAAGESGGTDIPGGADSQGGVDSPGGPGGPGGAGQEFGTFQEISDAAGIRIENGTVTYAEDWDGSISGEISEQGMDGASITANESNGIAISLPQETDTYVIGNSEISASAGLKNNDLGYEAAYGVGVAVNTGELWVRNSRLSSEGPRSVPVYLFGTAQPEATSLVVMDSEITTHTDKAELWMPPFKLLAGGSRATLLMTRNNSWFINSKVTSNNWGAISQDSVDAVTYVVNSCGTATEGGYGTYLTYAMKLYASQLYGGQYGAFLCGTSLLQTGTAADAMADVDAMSKTPDYTVQEQPTIIAGPFNAVVVHTSIPGLDRVAEGNFKDAILSTLTQDLPETVTPMAADDAFFLDPEAPFGVGSGSAYFYNRNLYGSLILIRSMNGDFTFDHTDARTSNDVLVQSVVTFDPPAAVGYLSAGQGEDVPGINVTFLNGEYTGDILHQDYQRRMSVTIGENGTLQGAVVSGTWQGWNDLWSEETLRKVLQEDGYQEVPFAGESWVQEVRENLIRSEDAAYAETENLGADVTVTAGGVWIVTGTSTVSSLTLEEGAVLTVPEGMSLSIYVSADASNANPGYEGGTLIAQPEPGTYENVILEVSGT